MFAAANGVVIATEKITGIYTIWSKHVLASIVWC